MTATPIHVGPYEVTRELGRGGMGVVYLARDSKLDRDVAIKVLPESTARDKERVLRFEREAKLLASLNHPNIAQIYGFETTSVTDRRAAGFSPRGAAEAETSPQSDDDTSSSSERPRGLKPAARHDGPGATHFFVLEYVEGETLAARIKRGALPVDEALEICKQIAEALEAAHEKGVIHRDLKPANVMVKPDGTVKVLDFGLARAMQGDYGGAGVMPDSPTVVAASPTITADFTRPGVVLGTAPYMSPEQARGRPLDKRTDIWSFGVILYECLTGANLFRGETATDSMGAIMHRDPDWTALPPDTPPTVQLLLRRCLTRDRNQRLHDIGDARIEIAHAIADPSSSSLGLAAAAIAAPAKQRSIRRWVFALTLVAGAAAAATWFATASMRRPPGPTVRLVIPSQTHAYKYANGMIVSPDGTRVAFVAPRRVGAGVGAEQLLWVRRLDEFKARELGTETTGGLFWSPDSQYIGFHAEGKLWSIRADGADKRPLASLDENDGATWNAAGVIVMAKGEQGLQILRAGTASIEPLTSLDAERFETAHARPHFLPDGDRYLYLALTFDPEQEIRSRLLYAGNLATGEQTLIGPFPSNTWYVEPGYLVYVEDGTVKAVPFDAQRLRIFGRPRILAQDAQYFRPTGHAAISASRTGVVVFAPRKAQQKLVWFDADGNRLGQVGPPAAFDSGHRISPDGQTVAAGIADPRTGLADIMLLGLQRDTSRRLTFDAHWEGQPVWSPDGKTIYFSTDRHGWPDVYSVEVSGGATPREVLRASEEWFPTDVSPDGRFLAIDGNNKETGFDIWIVPLEGEREPYAFSPLRGSQRDARFSPDGTRIAYDGGESGALEIYIDTFPNPAGAVQVSTHGGFSPVWSPDGKKLYFGQRPAGDRKWAVMSVEFTDSNPPTPLPPVVLFNLGPFDRFDLAPDGERFLLRLEPDETPDAHLILNWITP